jgi:uncharacterized membrane protein/uncharacterized membrane protein YeaQ/YmgE (transglycosylase-associated protein family)
MEALIWIATGMLSGWAAGKLMKGRDYGVSGNIILGLLGSLVGGWVFDALGFARPHDLWRHAAVSLMGALLTLGVARRLRPVARQTRKAFGDTSAMVVDLELALRKLGSLEHSTIDRLLKRGEHRDPNATFEERMTFGQRVADKVAQFGGSWTFIGSFLLAMVIWMIINGQLKHPFDPYPFILLNLCLSCVASLQAPVIMMSQNRQAMKDRLMATNDYEVNLRSELGIQTLHAHFDQLREQDWSELVKMQQRQIELLEGIVRDLSTKGDGAR